MVYGILMHFGFATLLRIMGAESAIHPLPILVLAWLARSDSLRYPEKIRKVPSDHWIRRKKYRETS